MPRTSQPSVVVEPRRAAQAQQDGAMVGLADLDLPRTIVTRLVKKQLGDSAKTSPDIILALVKSSTVFISHLIAAAHDETRRRNAKTITPQDVIQGIRETEFGGNSDSAEQLVEVLMEELEAFKKIQREVKSRTASKDNSKRPIQIEGDENIPLDADQTLEVVGANNENDDSTAEDADAATGNEDDEAMDDDGSLDEEDIRIKDKQGDISMNSDDDR